MHTISKIQLDTFSVLSSAFQLHVAAFACRSTSASNMCHWKLDRKGVIIPLHSSLLLTPCIICSFTLGVKKRVNVSVWISSGICCLACWPEYCKLACAAPVWFPSCSLHNPAHIPLHAHSRCVYPQPHWVSVAEQVGPCFPSVYNKSFMWPTNCMLCSIYCVLILLSLIQMQK